ncbi:pyridoxamine 5'-phosphate oxidase [Segetibacter sp. 3557_3]|uniref:pyridoxamine 5'-phosphate oxidase n=1 Tax=Segetibacter sp. 3557_3 TaxID=2547429 RepID=UPI001058F5B8|nr:pyridoxamine 5'-phosphate oxidase [Segetibacter sp. 3557_3]TDH25205.1 pyridoxamine 5'-phosphate oxidase [Segetibacter sp. 3557_3]
MRNNIADIRKDYKLQTLLEDNVHQDPNEQFSVWWNEALASSIEEVNAMTLATATRGGQVSARIVLLKGFDKNGFVFFTNYNSHKGTELDENPNAALVFFWRELERQVRIEGVVEKISEAESDAYYHSRPEGSRIGAWASPQSQIMSRAELEEKFEAFRLQFSEAPISRPPHWGGYRVKAHRVEFWQGRPSRLHDRILYEKDFQGNWKIERLAP